MFVTHKSESRETMSYKHLSITEREKIAIYRAMGWSLCQIAKKLGRNKSSISRELKRNRRDYLPSKAQTTYFKRRKKCCLQKKLSDKDLFSLVKKLFLDLHWSPEQIANRLKLDSYPIKISYKTIYRAIYGGMCYVSNRGKIATTGKRRSSDGDD